MCVFCRLGPVSLVHIASPEIQRRTHSSDVRGRPTNVNFECGRRKPRGVFPEVSDQSVPRKSELRDGEKSRQKPVAGAIRQLCVTNRSVTRTFTSPNPCCWVHSQSALRHTSQCFNGTAFSTEVHAVQRLKRSIIYQNQKLTAREREFDNATRTCTWNGMTTVHTTATRERYPIIIQNVALLPRRRRGGIVL